jgi:hypothetical protein
LLILLLLAILAGYAEDRYYASLSRTLVFFSFFSWVLLQKGIISSLCESAKPSFGAFVLAGSGIAFYCWGQDLRVEWLYGQAIPIGCWGMRNGMGDIPAWDLFMAAVLGVSVLLLFRQAPQLISRRGKARFTLIYCTAYIVKGIAAGVIFFPCGKKAAALILIFPAVIIPVILSSSW